MRYVPKPGNRPWRQEHGITGLETAIVLIAFVVVSSVFAFAALSTGLFSSDKSKETIHAGLEETRGTLEVKGGLRINATITTGQTGTGDVGAVGDKKWALTATPVQPGSETLTSGDGTTTMKLGADYSIDYDTGVITTVASLTQFTASYSKYTIDSIDVHLANAAGGADIDLTPGETLVEFVDDDDQFNISDFSVTPLGSANSDNFLEEGELFQVNMKVTSGNLTDQDPFSIKIKPPVGAVLNLARRVPDKIDTVMAVN